MVVAVSTTLVRMPDPSIVYCEAAGIEEEGIDS